MCRDIPYVLGVKSEVSCQIVDRKLSCHVETGKLLGEQDQEEEEEEEQQQQQPTFLDNNRSSSLSSLQLFTL
ncbi:hypothetical protein RUM43_008874 [Polyplax serrata]|uniref:Uncharacterized protein n=1 Tax=Polyplax serrata TaxID=468196 RepID=A0AAN8NV10_POLSC